VNATADAADKGKRIKEALAADPRRSILFISCVAGDLKVRLGPGGGSKYKDVPFSPKKYEIVSSPGPGQFGVILSLEAKNFFNFDVVGTGTLVITKWDKTGIAATFSLEAEEEFPWQGMPKRKVKVDGVVDMKCVEGENCQR
jgi:hypothetical protein